MCLLVLYYASNNKFMCFANANPACVMLGNVLCPAITARAWCRDIVQLIDSLSIGRLFLAAEIA